MGHLRLDGFSSQTQQLQLPDGQCIDVNHGNGPAVGLYACHNASSKDLSPQQFLYDKATGQLVSVSATGPQKKCATLAVTTPNDCGSAVFFPHDHTVSNNHHQQDPPRAYAVATFGELRGGNLSLVSSQDLIQWQYGAPLLQTRYDMWDNATLSSGARRSWATVTDYFYTTLITYGRWTNQNRFRLGGAVHWAGRYLMARISRMCWHGLPNHWCMPSCRGRKQERRMKLYIVRVSNRWETTISLHMRAVETLWSRRFRFKCLDLIISETDVLDV